MTFLVRGLVCFGVLLSTALAWAGHGAAPASRPAILLVAFGTTVAEARADLERLEARVRERFPGVEVRWATTSRLVRERLRAQGVAAESPALALARLADDGFTHVAVQSLHVIPGEEFHGLVTTAARLEGLPKGLTRVRVGAPLLASTEDVRRAAAALAHLARDRGRREAVVFFGHGSPHGGDVFYTALQHALQGISPWLFVTTVEGLPSMEETVEALAQAGATRARLVPLMAVAGEHARADMAGNDPESLASRLLSRGIRSEPVLTGLAGNPALAELWLDHLGQAWAALELP